MLNIAIFTFNQEGQVFCGRGGVLHDDDSSPSTCSLQKDTHCLEPKFVPQVMKQLDIASGSEEADILCVCLQESATQDKTLAAFDERLLATGKWLPPLSSTSAACDLQNSPAPLDSEVRSTSRTTRQRMQIWLKQSVHQQYLLCTSQPLHVPSLSAKFLLRPTKETSCQMILFMPRLALNTTTTLSSASSAKSGPFIMVFLNSHLPSGEKDAKGRIADMERVWKDVVVARNQFLKSAKAAVNGSGAAIVHDLSVLEEKQQLIPTTFFWAGDLNFRNVDDNLQPKAKVVESNKDQLYQRVLSRPPNDARNIQLPDLRECTLEFSPTCKLKRGKCAFVSGKQKPAEEKKCYNSKRTPSSCDRILYTTLFPRPSSSTRINVTCALYDSIRIGGIECSDHAGVIGKFVYNRFST